MTPVEFRETLVKMIKACGEELIERAEDLVGDDESFVSFDISINFPVDGYRFDGIPTIEVNKSLCSMKAAKILIDVYKGE